MRRRIGIIGGTGLYRWNGGEHLEIETPYGPVTVEYSRAGSREFFFIPRHGFRHELPPHRVNSRAQLKAIEAAHVDHVLAVFNTGAVAPGVEADSWVIPQDFIDHTRGRSSTFHDNEAFHADMTQPYCPAIRGALAATAGRSVREGGIYAAVEGPRFESAAEAKILRQEGATVVGMTGVPEVVLARELGLCYAAVCFVANPAAAPAPDVRRLQTALARKLPALREWLNQAVAKLPAKKTCHCARAPANALLARAER